MEPAELTLHWLQEITDDFSEERKLGQGAFGKVYRGEDKNGQVVAVKLLHNIGPGLHDEDFMNEFANLKRLNHPHITKLIGYCYETKHRCVDYNGKTIFAEQTYRALCLEYLHNGSLQNFLSEGICDGRLDWHTRFKIIKGACEGLKYLHEEFGEPIYHLDLKPDNILLDMNMVPKLADFGLSKVFGGEQTRITYSCIGTVGYMPPEYIEKGVISKMFDIYSLGVVMIKTISGLSGLSKRDEMPTEEFINLVHDSWRVKLQEKWSGSPLEAYCQQVKRCTEIALNCLEFDRHNRPNILAILQELRLLETAADETSRCPGSEILSVYPFQLVFPSSLELDQPRMVCSLHLSNNTDDEIEYRLLIPGQKKEYAGQKEEHAIADHAVFRLHQSAEAQLRFIGQLSGRVHPRTTHTCFLTMLEHAEPPPNRYEFFTFESWRHRQKDEVHQVKLLARYEPSEARNTTSKIGPDTWESSMDVHPTEPWIIMGTKKDNIFIYNYETQKTKMVTIKNKRSLYQFCFGEYHSYLTVTSAKFIARKKWIVMGDNYGRIFVCSYDTEEKIHLLGRAHSKSVNSIAVHPFEPYMLSASEDGYIKLWDFEKEWKVIRVFGHFVFPWEDWQVKQHKNVVFNPKDPSIFVSVQDNRIKIWNLHQSECMFTSAYTTEREMSRSTLSSERKIRDVSLSMHYLNYFTQGNALFLIGSFSEGILKIWDFPSMECVNTLKTPHGALRTACSHPDLPILITGSDNGTVCLWNSTTFNFSKQYWQAVNIQGNFNLPVFQMMEQASRNFQGDFFMEVFITAAWHIWKQRNEKIFEQAQQTLQRWKQGFKRECYLQAYRMKGGFKDFFPQLGRRHSLSFHSFRVEVRV